METQITTTTNIEAVKERLGNKYYFLRITEDAKGLHVYNIQLRADLLLYREPVGLFGRAMYGRIIYEDSGDFRYLEKAQFDHALQKLFDMADEVCQGKA